MHVYVMRYLNYKVPMLLDIFWVNIFPGTYVTKHF